MHKTFGSSFMGFIIYIVAFIAFLFIFNNLENSYEWQERVKKIGAWKYPLLIVATIVWPITMAGLIIYIVYRIVSSDDLTPKF